MNKFASYEKEVISKVIKIKHTVRIRLDSSALDVVQAFKYVPPEARVKKVIDDDTLAGYGEIIFEEELNES